MRSLTALPYEVLAQIVLNVDFDDVISLGKTCRAFEFLRIEGSICTSILKTKVAFSKEARVAIKTGRGSATALRSVAKRREAITVASPFIVAIVAVGDEYLYCNGVLCYVLDDQIRVLDLHNSGQQESVISIPGLLAHVLRSSEVDKKGKLRILYYSENVISCLYRPLDSNAEAWLVAFTVTRILVVKELASTGEIFVRNNERYLYYGTYSRTNDDKIWMIHGFDFEIQEWFSRTISLPGIVGSAIGVEICFKFYQGYLYILSNQETFEVQEMDWTSCYRCLRFPLDCPREELLEEAEGTWRRQHDEGPINNRYTRLYLDEDETTGKLKAVESRREWYRGSSECRVTYYKTDIMFPVKEEERDFEFGSNPSTPAPTSSSSFTIDQNISSLSNDLRLPDNTRHEHHTRLPHNTHQINDRSVALSKPSVSYYYPSASTHLDLIDESDPTNLHNKQRLRLWAGSRKLGPPLTYPLGPSQGLLRPSIDLETALEEVYWEQPIARWPPAQDPDHPDKNLDEVYEILNPSSYLGNVQGTADERSLVYMTGKGDQPRPIVFVSFDPAIKLVGLKRWGRLGNEGRKADVETSECMDSEARSRINMVWARTKKAMYRDIKSGFYFGL